MSIQSTHFRSSGTFGFFCYTEEPIRPLCLESYSRRNDNHRFLSKVGRRYFTAFLLANVPHLSSSRPTKCGPSQYTVFNPQNHEEIVKCQDCPTCPRGQGVPEQCGSRVADGTSTQCKPCELGKSFSNTTDSSTCLSCHECGKKTVLQQCTLTENRKCGECPANYFLERHLNDCVECFTCCSDVPDNERMEQCGKDLGLPASQWCEPNEKNKLCAKLNTPKHDEANKTTTSTSTIVSQTSATTVSLVESTESSRSSISINKSTIATDLAGKTGQTGNSSTEILISSSCTLAILFLVIILIYKKWSARKTSSTNRNEEYVEVETENPEVQQSNNMNMRINVDDIPEGKSSRVVSGGINKYSIGNSVVSRGVCAKYHE